MRVDIAGGSIGGLGCKFLRALSGLRGVKASELKFLIRGPGVQILVDVLMRGAEIVVRGGDSVVKLAWGRKANGGIAFFVCAKE